MNDSTTSTWTMDHLRGAQRLAAEDAAQMERLNLSLSLARGGPSGDECACGCGAELPANFSGDMLIGCRKRIWMREDRARKAAAREAEKAKSTESVRCVCCGQQTRKWSPAGNLRKCCDDCAGKHWRRRRDARVVEVTP